MLNHYIDVTMWVLWRNTFESISKANLKNIPTMFVTVNGWTTINNGGDIKYLMHVGAITCNEMDLNCIVHL